MTCQESLVVLSSLQKFDFHGINQRNDAPGKMTFNRLCRICLPIRLNHSHSGKKQKLLFSLIDSSLETKQYKDYVISQLLLFFGGLDFRNVAWTNLFESGFARSLLIKLLSVTDDEVQSDIIQLVVDNLEKVAISNGSTNSQIEIRNRLFLIQEFFYVIAMTPSVSLLKHLDKIIRFGAESIHR
jgi:hypothetical protein